MQRMKSVINKSFVFNVISWLVVFTSFISVIIKTTSSINKILVFIPFFCIVAFVLFFILRSIPYCYRFDNKSVEIHFVFDSKTKKWLWKDIDKIDVEIRDFNRSYSMVRINFGRVFRKYFRLWHIDKNGNIDYGYIIKSRKAQKYISQYGRIEIQGL